MLEEKLLKVDDLARNVDRLSLDVDSLKLRSTPPKHDINESIIAMRISIDECKERTARLRAKKDCFVKACSSGFHENNDDDLKVIEANEGKLMYPEFSKYDYYLPNFKDLETFTVLLTIILGATILFALDYYDKKRAH